MNPSAAISRGYFIESGPSTDWLTVRVAAAPACAAGDAQFLDAAPDRRAQLRPALRSELTPGRHYPRGTRMLVFRPEAGMELRAFVRLPPHCRENTPSNVELAIRRVERFDAASGEAFRQTMYGANSDQNKRRRFDSA